jgi:PAS domain S-box-containing protein
MGVIIDITHLKEVEEALRESELRLRFALEAAQMGTFVADMTAGEVSIDALEARLLGLPDETRCVSTELLGKRIAVMDLTESDAKRARLFQDDEPYRHELRLQMQDGSERWLSTHADVRSNRVFGINFDITRRKQAEARLRDSEERLRIATSGAALGVFEWDTETDHASFENERMYEIFGHRRGDGALCLRQFVDNSLHPQDADLFETALTTAHQSADGFHTTVRIRRADGEERWLQIDAALHESTPGRRSRLLGVMADVTERKALEERTKQLSDYLVTIQESERQRIAQELHDSTAQHLVAAGLNLMSLRPPDSSGETAKLWDETEACLQEAMKELRTFSHLMHPPALEYDGLCSTLRQYVDRFGNRSGLEIKIRVNSKLDQLPAHLQRTLLRIIQEALGNVHRHAAASQAIVDLRFIGESIHLLVTDNGSGGDGLETWGPSKSGGGITGMRTRVDQYDGKFQIRMGPSGTTIRVVIPARSGREKGRLERPPSRRASLQRHEA